MTQADYLILEETILLFWDTKENYEKSITQQKLAPDLFKEVILIDGLEKMHEVMKKAFNKDQKFLFFVHLHHAQENSGLDSFKRSRITFYYPNLTYYFVTSSSKKNIFSEDKNNTLDVYTYDTIHANIKSFVRQTKAEMGDKTALTIVDPNAGREDYPQIDYAIITALFEHEFEKVKDEFEWVKSENVSTDTKLFRIGHVKGRPKKKVVAAVQSATGMIDAGILATLMLEYFKPKYLFMAGVCGGVPDLKMGSIVVASKLFTFQKGKVSDLVETEDGVTQIFDEHRNLVDVRSLYDKDRNPIKIGIEKFQVEHDEMPEIDPLIKDNLEDNVRSIQDEINRPYAGQVDQQITIELSGMACSTVVINREGYFSEKIKGVDRKTLAVDMESYAVARACKFANGGRTKWVIFKSVMDYTTGKSDRFKEKAAFTSATFLRLLLERDIL